MVPDFALSLLFQGICLHRRTPDGWALVGEVPLDSPDLAGALADLREAGMATGALWRSTHVLLPPEQIRTLVLDGDRDEGEVLAALEGMTPYAVADLVVDHARAGGRTHVAAVARETLEEALAFAEGHGFRPTSLGARLEGFPREASFGLVQGSADEAVVEAAAHRDVVAAPLEDAGPVAPAEDPNDILAATVPVPVPVAEETSVPAPQASSHPVHLEAVTAPEGTAFEAQASDAPGEWLARDEAPPQFLAITGTDAVDAGPDSTDTLRDGRMSRSGRDTAVSQPPIFLETVTAEEPPASAEIAMVPDAQGDERGLAVSHSETDDPLRSESSVAWPGGELELSAEPGALAELVAAQTRGFLTHSSQGNAPAAVLTPSQQDDALQALPGPQEPRDLVFGRPEPRLTLGAANPGAIAPSPTPAPRTMTSIPGAVAETRRRRSFGATQRGTFQVGGKPRFLGLGLTVALLVVMAAVAVLASVTEGGFAGLFRQADPVTVVAATEPDTESEVAAAPLIPVSDAAAQAAAGRVAEALLGFGGGVNRTDAPERPEASVAVAAAPEALERPAAEAGGTKFPVPELPTEEPSVAVDPTRAEPPLAVADESAAEPLPAGVTPSPAEADRVYAATGVWLRAPRLLALPADATPDGPGLPALSPAKALGAPPVLAALDPDAGIAAQFDPPGPGDTRPRDERGLILATPEGTLSPSGVLLIAGRPPRVPPVRPEMASAESDQAVAPWVNAMAKPPGRLPPARPQVPADFLAALATQPAVLAFSATTEAGPALGSVSLAGLRPASRPGDLSPPPGFEPPPTILASYDGPRPGARPDGLAPEEEPGPDVDGALAQALTAPEAPAAPDLQSTLAAIVQGAPDPLAGATPRAIPVARIPDARPQNFSRVVQRQLDRVARASQGGTRSAGGVGTGGLTAQEQAEAGEAEAASGAAAAPNGPTPTSVAQAATLSDAMRLRDMNLIGVYGQPGARRALVRMGNGRYLRVSVGDALDGGQVTAIGDNALNYVRRGRTEVLVIPGG